MNFQPNQAVTVSNFSDISNILSVPLVVSANQLYFGNFQRLQDTLLQRFEIIVNTNMTLSADGATLVSEANADKMYLNLLDKNGNKLVDGIPLSKFKVNTTSTANNTYAVFPGFDNVDVDWQKSYVSLDATTLAAASGQTLQVQISYIWRPGTGEFNRAMIQREQRKAQWKQAMQQLSN